MLKSINNFTFEDRPIKPLNPKQVRVHIESTGICGSDVTYATKGRIGKFILHPGQDMVLGHESGGTVVEIGSDVDPKVVNVGDRVAIEPGVPCRYCAQCRDGFYGACRYMVFAATPPDDGTLSKFYSVDYDYVYKVPDTMSDEEAALIEPVSVAVQIAKRGQIKATDTVVVFGCGPIGLLCQAVAKAYGCRKVIGVDISVGRLEFAKTYGADHVYPMPFKSDSEDTEDFAKRVSEEMKQKFDIDSYGADVILEATGAEPCIQVGVFLARPEGRFVQAGMGKEFVSFPLTEALIKQLNWTGSIRYSAGVYPTAVDLVATGKVDVKRLITHRFSFDDAEKAFALVQERRTDVIKVVIDGVRD